MKYKVLKVNTPGFQFNIGDYIQALASSQFLPSFDGFIDREHLDTYSDEETKVIMNGWYMHHPENWPPSSSINPLFVAFHINKYTQGKMLSDKGINYLRKHEPIGCRDYYTVSLLKQNGIDAYFSGCMTLTLGEKYANMKKEDKCCFVDPLLCIKWNKWKSLINLLQYIFFYKKDIDVLSSRFDIGVIGIRKKIRLVSFYKEYMKFFTRDTIINAEYICHVGDDYRNSLGSDENCLREAEKLVKKYASVKLVITSRIHCALPCLGIGTPVVYIDNYSHDDISSCRMSGLKDLFNIILTWKDNKLTSNKMVDKKISIDNTFENKTDWEKLSSELKSKVRNFIRTDK